LVVQAPGMVYTETRITRYTGGATPRGAPLTVTGKEITAYLRTGRFIARKLSRTARCASLVSGTIAREPEPRNTPNTTRAKLFDEDSRSGPHHGRELTWWASNEAAG
jgi:hypothetical protein